MDDLISRKAAIEAIKNCESGENFEYNEGLIAAMNAVIDTPSAQKWISTDYNPMTTSLYLVLCDEWGGDRVRICSYYSEAGKWIKDGKNITKHVTHWMPLPEPPKEE